MTKVKLAGPQSKVEFSNATYVSGRRYRGNMRQLSLSDNSGKIVHLGGLTEELLDDLFAAGSDQINDTPIDAVIGFLKNVGRNWKQRDYIRRQLYVRDLITTKGYSEKMAQTEADWIAILLCSDNRLYDSLQCELGSRHALDNWILRDESYVRAYPIGTVLHLAPGNVPLSVVVSIIRAILTKNQSIVKVSADDLFTATALLQSFCDVDQDHPVTRAISVVYWPSNNDPIGARVAGTVDAIVAWGGSEAIQWASTNAGQHTVVIPFGPKHSLGVVGNGADIEEAAKAVALDASLYDQRACFSLRRVFVEESQLDAFVPQLQCAMDNISNILPRSQASFDELATSSLSGLSWSFDELDSVQNANWSILVCQPSEVRDHPLQRSVFVHPIQEPEHIADYLDSSVQTIGVMPFSIGERIRDLAGSRGVSRVVELGLHNIFRTGGAHDGIYALQRLVRWVNHELPASNLIKGINVQIDQTNFIDHDRIAEFAP